MKHVSGSKAARPYTNNTSNHGALYSQEQNVLREFNPKFVAKLYRKQEHERRTKQAIARRMSKREQQQRKFKSEFKIKGHTHLQSGRNGTRSIPSRSVQERAVNFSKSIENNFKNLRHGYSKKIQGGSGIPKRSNKNLGTKVQNVPSVFPTSFKKWRNHRHDRNERENCASTRMTRDPPHSVRRKQHLTKQEPKNWRKPRHDFFSTKQQEAHSCKKSTLAKASESNGRQQLRNRIQQKMGEIASHFSVYFSTTERPKDNEAELSEHQKFVEESKVQCNNMSQALNEEEMTLEVKILKDFEMKRESELAKLRGRIRELELDRSPRRNQFMLKRKMNLKNEDNFARFRQTNNDIVDIKEDSGRSLERKVQTVIFENDKAPPTVIDRVMPSAMDVNAMRRSNFMNHEEFESKDECYETSGEEDLDLEYCFSATEVSEPTISNQSQQNIMNESIALLNDPIDEEDSKERDNEVAPVDPSISHQRLQNASSIIGRFLMRHQSSTPSASPNNNQVTMSATSASTASNANAIDRHIISLVPNASNLNMTGVLPSFSTFSSVNDYFDRFMDDITAQARAAESPNFSTLRLKQLIEFVIVIARRIKAENEHRDEYREYLDEVISGATRRGEYAIKAQAHANLIMSRTNQSNWRLDTQFGVSFEDSSGFNPPSNVMEGNTSALGNVTPSSGNNNINSSGGSDGGSEDSDGDSGGDSSDESCSSSSNSSKGKNHRKSKSRKKLSARAKEDKRYIKIISCLSRSAKNFSIKTLSIHPDPSVRRERFKTWVTDVSNILSTNHRTFGKLDNYPSQVDKFRDQSVDRAIKAILFSLTTGQAKELISNAPSAYEALVDLKRHFPRRL